MCIQVLRCEFAPKLITRACVAVYADCYRTFLCEGLADGCADSLRAAGYEYNFICQVQVHERQYNVRVQLQVFPGRRVSYPLRFKNPPSIG